MFKFLLKHIFLFKKKIIFLFIFLFIFYIFTLNNLVNNKIKNKNFTEFPTIIYSRIINIDCKMKLNKNEIINILLLSKYNKKKKINKPGEFEVDLNFIKLFKRSFEFPNKFENKIILIMKFNNNVLEKINDINNNLIKNINIEPQIITLLNNSNKEQRLFLSRKHFPDTLVNILIEIEDKKYYLHNGINYISIIRAFIKNIYKRKIIEGGSTLTQQLSKNLFLHKKKTLIRKINEMFISFLIEYKFSKDRILEFYLNEVYFGKIGDKDIKGFPLASILYFGKPINELDLNEQISLISIIKGASLYNPWKNPNLVIQRKNFILNKIRLKKIIDDKLYNFLISQNIIFKQKNEVKMIYPSFINILNKELIKKIPYNLLKRNNNSIFSTLDLNSQINSQNAIKLALEDLKKTKKIDNIEIAMLIIDTKTGEIKSSIGGFKYDFFGYNRIFSRRQIGSLIKPFIYIKALDNPKKFNLNTLLIDTPLSIKQKNNKYWNPKNFDGKYRGNVKLIDSLIHSLNIPTVNLGLEIGINNLIDILVSFGIDRKKINNFPSIFLGALDLTILEVAQIYHVISNYGNYINLSSVKYILDENNNIIYNNNLSFKKKISCQSSYLTLFCMENIVKYGTAKKINKYFPNVNLAGKTGTTNKFKDSWFVGIDNNEICVIWLGKDDNSSINLSGSEGAMYVYKKYLEKSKPKSLVLKIPKDIHYICIDKFGKFICNKHNVKEKIPVWIKNPVSITKKCENHNFFVKYLNNLFK